MLHPLHALQVDFDSQSESILLRANVRRLTKLAQQLRLPQWGGVLAAMEPAVWPERMRSTLLTEMQAAQLIGLALHHSQAGTELSVACGGTAGAAAAAAERKEAAAGGVRSKAGSRGTRQGSGAEYSAATQVVAFARPSSPEPLQPASGPARPGTALNIVWQLPALRLPRLFHWPFHLWPFHLWPFHLWPFHLWPFHLWPFHLWPLHLWPFHLWPFRVPLPS